jgi:hypothetical protein
MFTNNVTTDSIRHRFIDMLTQIRFSRKSNRKCALCGNKRNLWVIPKEARIDSLCYFICLYQKNTWRIFNAFLMNMEFISRETGFLIFSRVRSILFIKTLSHKWNKFYIHQQSIEFSVYYIFFNLKGFRAFTCSIASKSKTWRHNQFCYFHCENNRAWRYQFYWKNELQYLTVENVIKMLSSTFDWK